ncbi:hypothetical protein Tco_0738800 [Tanacetum coccineum]
MNMYKGRMPTKIELTLEQSQQGVSNDVLSPTHYPCDSARNIQSDAFCILMDDESFQCHHQTALRTAKDMWEAIERLQQGESLNIQDVKTNLFWEFGQFTSHDGETIESYYTRFYKMMNEMIRNNLTVATMQVNVQFLQQLQPECQDLSRL